MKHKIGSKTSKLASCDGGVGGGNTTTTDYKPITNDQFGPGSNPGGAIHNPIGFET